MKVYEQIKELMCDELEHIGRRNQLDPTSLEIAYKAIHTIKDIEDISEKQNEYSYGYSRDEGANHGNSTRFGMYPMLGNSFEQRDRGNSMGRYYGDGNSMGGYYAGGSNTKEELRKLMERATNETEKEAIRVAIESMNN